MLNIKKNLSLTKNSSVIEFKSINTTKNSVVRDSNNYTSVTKKSGASGLPNQYSMLKLVTNSEIPAQEASK